MRRRGGGRLKYKYIADLGKIAEVVAEEKRFHMEEVQMKNRSGDVCTFNIDNEDMNNVTDVAIENDPVDRYAPRRWDNANIDALF